jgi:hypothetical protein
MPIFARSASTFGEPPAVAGPTRSSRRPGRATRASTSANDKGRAKAYHVRQVLKALDKLAEAAQEGADDE